MEHKTISLKEISNVVEFISEAVEDLPSEKQVIYKDFLKSAKRATALLEKKADNEKATYFLASATVQANQLVFTLFRLNSLRPEMEEKFRKLPDGDTTAELVNSYMKEEEAEREKILDSQRKFTERIKDVDVFKGVLRGMRLEEAKKAQAEQEQKDREAIEHSNGQVVANHQ